MNIIDKSLAQKIVARVMKIIPYNINIMNQDGVIIASGDSDRIDTFHNGALKVLESKSIVEIREETTREKPGVNLPIKFDNEIIGVIGITGKPDEIIQFAQLVSITAELLVNESFILSQKKAYEMYKDKFLYELVKVDGEYTSEMYKHASDLGIELNLERFGMMIKVNNVDFNEYVKIKEKISMFLEEQEFIIEHLHNTFVVLVKRKIKQDMLIEMISKEDVEIGIALKSRYISKLVRQSEDAMKIGSIIRKDLNIFEYKDLYFLSVLSTCKGHEILRSHIDLLKKEGSKLDLIETIVAYVENNGEINQIAKKLNIHRNTLNYRMEKIYTMTGKNPKNYLDLLELYTSYILYY